MTEPRIHPSWVKRGGVALEIMQGKYDADLESIQQACTARLKDRFRKGQKIRLTGTRNVTLDGQEGIILKVNAKTVSVTIPGHGEYNVPPRMLEAV